MGMKNEHSGHTMYQPVSEYVMFDFLPTLSVYNNTL